MTDEMILALPNFDTSDLFTAAEKAALRFTETMAGDHRSVSQALFDELKTHYSEPEIMALGWRMAIFYRLRAAWSMQPVWKALARRVHCRKRKHRPEL